MKGEFVGYGDGADDLLVKIESHSEHIYHFKPQEISVHDVVSTEVTKPKTTKSKTKPTFNISFGY